MGKIIPVILAIFGLAGGVGAGLALRPSQDETIVMNPCGDETEDEHSGEEVFEESNDSETQEEESSYEYMKMNNQFVIPVVVDNRIKSLVVVTLNLEVVLGQLDNVYAREPKLRDLFLRVMFDHANAGGFDGEFTQSGKLNSLRLALTEIAHKNFSGVINDVLILDIVRQDSF